MGEGTCIQRDKGHRINRKTEERERKRWRDEKRRRLTSKMRGREIKGETSD